MLTRIIQRALRNTLHRWPAKFVLLGYVWMCCGGTVPATLLMSSETLKKSTAKDCSVPFPCMNKPCGCRNAEQCYKSCCCSTKAERIAWAKAHDVSEEYIALAENADEQPAAKSCCASKAASSKSCCKPAASTESCCGKTSPAKKQQSQQPAEKGPAPGFSMLAALKCAGLQVGALGVPLSLPLDLDLVLPLEAPFVGRVIELAPTFSSPFDTPDGPPPRG